IEPAVGTVPGVDLRDYQATLVERFANPAVADQVLRLCEDGSTKIPNMILAPVAELVDAGLPFAHAAFALAAWIRFLGGEDEHGATIPLNDPNAAQLTRLAGECARDVAPFVDRSLVFPDSLRSDRRFRAAVGQAYGTIRSCGTRVALQALLTTEA
ncbi:MAG: mannitol dehydrogenase family protein, partial [Planctomycetota bacterium]